NCDEFIYYEDVWRDNQKGPKLDGLNKKTAEAFSLMVESIQALIRENKDALLQRGLLRLQLLLRAPRRRRAQTDPEAQEGSALRHVHRDGLREDRGRGPAVDRISADRPQTPVGGGRWDAEHGDQRPARRRCDEVLQGVPSHPSTQR